MASPDAVGRQTAKISPEGAPQRCKATKSYAKASGTRLITNWHQIRQPFNSMKIFSLEGKSLRVGDTSNIHALQLHCAHLAFAIGTVLPVGVRNEGPTVAGLSENSVLHVLIPKTSCPDQTSPSFLFTSGHSGGRNVIQDGLSKVGAGNVAKVSSHLGVARGKGATQLNGRCQSLTILCGACRTHLDRDEYENKTIALKDLQPQVRLSRQSDCNIDAARWCQPAPFSLLAGQIIRLVHPM